MCQASLSICQSASGTNPHKTWTLKKIYRKPRDIKWRQALLALITTAGWPLWSGLRAQQATSRERASITTRNFSHSVSVAKLANILCSFSPTEGRVWKLQIQASVNACRGDRVHQYEGHRFLEAGWPFLLPIPRERWHQHRWAAGDHEVQDQCQDTESHGQADIQGKSRFLQLEDLSRGKHGHTVTIQQI